MTKKNRKTTEDKKDRHAVQKQFQGQVTSAMVFDALKAASGHAKTYQQIAERYSLPKEAAYSQLDSWTRKGWCSMHMATVNGKQRRVFTLTAAGKTAFSDLTKKDTPEGKGLTLTELAQVAA